MKKKARRIEIRLMEGKGKWISHVFTKPQARKLIRELSKGFEVRYG